MGAFLDRMAAPTSALTGSGSGLAAPAPAPAPAPPPPPRLNGTPLAHSAPTSPLQLPPSVVEASTAPAAPAAPATKQVEVLRAGSKKRTRAFNPQAAPKVPRRESV